MSFSPHYYVLETIFNSEEEILDIQHKLLSAGVHELVFESKDLSRLSLFLILDALPIARSVGYLSFSAMPPGGVDVMGDWKALWSSPVSLSLERIEEYFLYYIGIDILIVEVCDTMRCQDWYASFVDAARRLYFTSSIIFVYSE